jgi:hypothetical protein
MDPWSPEWFLRSIEQGGPAISGTIGLAEPPSRHDRDADPQDRVSERVSIELGAGLRQRGAHGVSVQIMDLSTHGFRATTHLDLDRGADVWLRLPGLEAIQAKVVWVKGYIIGCAFERPLHPAVLEMIVSKSRGR